MASVLSALQAASGADATLNEVCERTGLSRSTASRFLNALAEHGFVYRSNGGRFALGARPAELGRTPLAHGRLAELAHPHMRSLADDVNEAVCISVLDGIETQTIYQVGVPQPVFVENWVDRRWPIRSSGSAISIMSTWSPTAIEAVVGRLPKPDRAGVYEAIDATRASGVSWSADTYVGALTSVAAPIVDRRGYGAAAVIIYGPSFRFPKDHGVKKIEKKLTLAAAAIGKELF